MESDVVGGKPLPSPSFQRLSLSALNEWSRRNTFPGRRPQAWACAFGSAWGVWALLRVSDVGEEAGSLEMFVFSSLMVDRRFSQKIQDKGKKWQSNAHFSGVSQPQHVKAFHVVCFNREHFPSFCCLLLNWSQSRWLESERGVDEFLPLDSCFAFQQSSVFIFKGNSPLGRAAWWVLA